MADLGAEVDDSQLQSALEGAREEEIQALQAIFGEECYQAEGANCWVLPANAAGVVWGRSVKQYMFLYSRNNNPIIHHPGWPSW